MEMKMGALREQGILVEQSSYYSNNKTCMFQDSVIQLL